MQYRNNKKGEKLSILGLGCMRFPTIAGKVDYAKTKAMIDFAVESGVNYFDTAYIYHAGQSESITGRALQEHREKVSIATKLPPYLVRKPEDIEKIFQTQLGRLQTTYIDYYLMHALKDLASWEKLVKHGIIEWIAEKKKSGAIRNIGFSFHGTQDGFIKLVDAYDWDFCQIQYNYLDEATQAGKVGLEYAHKKGLPVIIMGPLSGGRLAGKHADDVQSVFDKSVVKRTNTEWALRWIWNHKEVTVVLSGMSNLKQLQENVEVASGGEKLEVGLTEEELGMFESVKKIMKAKNKIPCTGCAYCVPCPYNVDIPGCFNSYNNLEIDGFYGKMKHLGFTSGMMGGVCSGAKKCITCGKCKVHCPQDIDIPAELKVVNKKLEGFLYNTITRVMRK